MYLDGFSMIDQDVVQATLVPSNALSADDRAAFQKELQKRLAQQLQSLPAQTMSFLCVEWMKQTSNIFDNKDDPTKSLDMLGRW
jgi:hypothetical protein